MQFQENFAARRAPACGLRLPRVLVLTTMLLPVLTGCASVALDHLLAPTRSELAALTDTQLQLALTPDQQVARDAQARSILAKPLDQAGCVALLFVNSARIQALLAQAWADTNTAGQQGRLSNPSFGIEHVAAGNALELTRRLSFALLDLLTLPQRAAYADRRVRQVQLKLLGDAVDDITQVRQAWVRAVAARQTLNYAEQVKTLADTSGELARRLQVAGNFTRLQQARLQTFYADANTQLLLAQYERTASRENLIRQLGLSDEQAALLRLPDRLPDLPDAPRSDRELASLAPTTRIDVRLAQIDFDTAAASQGLNRLTSWTDVELGIRHDTQFNTAPGRNTQLNGYEARVRLPLFDQGELQRDGMNASTLAAAQRLTATLNAAGSKLRERYAAYRAAYDIVRHIRQDVLPVRQTINEENVLSYNGMLVSVFELLADAHDQVTASVSEIAAERQFWLEDAALQAALLGQPSNFTGEPK